MKPNPKNIEEREAELRKLAGDSQEAGFGVPSGYFDDFQKLVISQIHGAKDDGAIGIEGLGNETPFGLPDGYFENLSDKIVSRIQKQEDNIEVELLKLTGNTIAFGVPQSYFEQSQAEILSKVNALSGKAEKHITIRPIQRYYRAIAIAAMVVFAFGLGFYTNAPEKPVNYANNNAVIAKPDLNKLSTEELEAALKQEEVSDELLALFSGQKEASEASLSASLRQAQDGLLRMTPQPKTNASQRDKEDLEKYILEHVEESQLIEEF